MKRQKAIILSVVGLIAFPARSISQISTVAIKDTVATIGAPDSPIAIGFPYDYALLGTDTLYVLDSRSREVIGVNLRNMDYFTFGGFGQGPGEFQTVKGIAVHRNHIYISDSRLNRISEFYPSGEFIESYQVPRPPAFIVGHGKFLYVSIRSSSDIVYRINLEMPNLSGVFLSYDNDYLIEIEVRQRPQEALLAFMVDQLVVGLPNCGKLLLLSLEEGQVERCLTPKNDMIGAYWEDVQYRISELPGNRGLVPKVFIGMSIWRDSFITLEVNQPRNRVLNSPSTIIFIDPTNGDEVGQRWASNGPYYALHKILSDDLLGWISQDDSVICLFNLLSLAKTPSDRIK